MHNNNEKLQKHIIIDIAGVWQIFHKNFFFHFLGKFSLEKKEKKSFYEKFAGRQQ
jgi:hypothetical protein